MARPITPILAIAVVCIGLSACGLMRDDGDVVETSDTDIKINIGYDAALKGQHPERLAGDHCADEDKRAVWYGHDRDGNLHYRCE